MAHALITGGTGFIGRNLVKLLIERGDDVTCLVRSKASLDSLEWASSAGKSPRLVFGDVTDRLSVRAAVRDVDVVYHLAGVTKAFRKSALLPVNQTGVENVAEACSTQSGKTTLVLVSSLAAAGPAVDGKPKVESDRWNPVSNYGLSKLAGEIAARRFAGEVPTSIVRPPIVMGEGDSDGLESFKSIVRWGVHLSPGMNPENNRVSLIDAKDLATALTLLAEKGERVGSKGADTSVGVYFAAADETPTYSELGRMIGRAVGRPNVAVVQIPHALVWAVAGISDVAGRIRRRPNILNWDKAREAVSGSWTCSAEKLRQDTGFEPAQPMSLRLRQTAEWYFCNGWLSPSPIVPTPRRPSSLEQIGKAGQKKLSDS
ncbi:MAG: SDR family NAD(P)-dependent oxidoreductase [Rubripirellula sp.]